MALSRTCILDTLTIAEGVTRHAMRVDTSDKHWVNKPYYEMVTTVDGKEFVTKVRTDASAILWMDQAREDASAYAADLDMIAYNKQAAKDRKASKRAAQPVQLALTF
jgi:hypothetical protein